MSRLTKNNEESLRLSKHKRLRAKKGQCYLNALNVVQRFPEYVNATYVEGIAVSHHGLEFEHAWLEHNGEIIDPTIPCEDLAYFPGLRCEGEQGIAERLATTDTVRLPFFYSFGWGGRDLPSFREARRLASESVKQMIEQCSVVS